MRKIDGINLSIIIVGYKNVDVLIKCLDSIKIHNDISNKLEVIVVDNSPNKMYIYNTISEKYKWVKIIKNKNNGFGQANNVGVKYSKGEFLLFLNPDTILIEPIMKFAIDKFNNDKYLASFGVCLLNQNGQKNYSFFWDYKCTTFYFLLNKILNRLDIFIEKYMYISGADIFMRKSIFEEIDGFDDNIFMYCEEPDIIRRVRQKNKKYKVKYFKEKRIIHLEGKSSKVRIEALKDRLNSSIYYGEKFGLNVLKRLKGECNYVKFKRKIYYFKNYRKAKELDDAIMILEEEVKKYRSKLLYDK